MSARVMLVPGVARVIRCSPGRSYISSQQVLHNNDLLAGTRIVRRTCAPRRVYWVLKGSHTAQDVEEWIKQVRSVRWWVMFLW